ncbi:magnesium chelatase, partial [Pseudomonas sp. CrR7]|nr:magnesium chelatase [Pseudomonas sp. CM27]
ALRHRRRAAPQTSPQSAPPQPDQQGTTHSGDPGGQGDWGALPPQPVASGARREVPNWAKKP